ncbi:hypothetical protein [Pseudomonas sp. PSB11]|uniref:hypothetical protein n=1 Tax=Pseudomonas sp. PSB11 TaxID=2021969 RepID=UPI001660B309|nr:hypothetical protein [Pseudomonas sp. PSB11]MBD0679931.1 hypothetical protein [Pseudomonas sp. PSB11]
MTNKYKDAALARGKERTAEIEHKVLAAMDNIMVEIKANDGIYPYNGGALSKNEVARRAGIGKSTFFSPKQVELSFRVDLWLDAIKKKEAVGRIRVRRTYAERIEVWKAKYQALENSHIKTELDLQSAQAELEEELTLVANLKAQNAVLLEQLRKAGASKVTSITKRSEHP